MRKIHVIITSFAIASLCGMAAFAAPAAKPAAKPAPKDAPDHGMVPPPHAEMFEDRFANAPEEIKKSAAELKSLGKDLRLELCKDNPDSAKAMEMFTKLQELRTKVHGWLVQQILDGKAPKPDMHGMKKGHPGPHHGGSWGPGPDHMPPAPFECHCSAQPMPLPGGPMGGPMPFGQPEPPMHGVDQ